MSILICSYSIDRSDCAEQFESIRLARWCKSRQRRHGIGLPGHVRSPTELSRMSCPHFALFTPFANHFLCQKSLIRSVYFSENKGIFNTTTPTPSLVVVQANQCFDFLVQSIKCNADLSLESKTDEGGNFRGWGESRTCKRWESVMDFMGRHRYKEAEKAIDHHAHGDDDDEEDEHHHG